jgi:endonuclease-3
MEPLDELIFTVLTQHTSDLNAERAFAAMRTRYPDWQAVVSADPADLADALRPGGLANQKAPRVQQILRRVFEARGEFDISFLGGLPLEQAREWLTALPGVGPKTAAVVLAFSFGMPALPVDTHVHRVATRLGLLGKKTSADDAHELLEALVKPQDRFAFHVLLITHGRRTCRARAPLCGSCPLARECPSTTV